MKNIKVAIFGFGSIGRLHYKIIRQTKNIDEIIIYTKQNLKKISHTNNLNEIIKFNPDYIVIASKTSDHYKNIIFIEKNFKKKIILVEKPIFNKNYKFIPKNNTFFVNYNLRLNPIIQYLKEYIKRKKIFLVKSICSSYLPNWRKNINYKNSYSSKKNQGGGVEFDLSHEIDYIIYLFGKFKTLNLINNKISNLNINSNDNLLLNGLSKNKIHINFFLNYYGYDNSRKCYIYTNNETVEVDFIKNCIFFFNKNKSYIKKFPKTSKYYTYQLTHKYILNGNYDKICDFNEAEVVLEKIIK